MFVWDQDKRPAVHCLDLYRYWYHLGLRLLSPDTGTVPLKTHVSLLNDHGSGKYHCLCNTRFIAIFKKTTCNPYQANDFPVEHKVTVVENSTYVLHTRVSEPACFGTAPAPGIFIRLLVKKNKSLDFFTTDYELSTIRFYTCTSTYRS